MISKLLTTDPAKRYTISDVRQHVWYTQLTHPTDPDQLRPERMAAPSCAEDLDQDILKEMTMMGFDAKQVNDSLHHDAVCVSGCMWSLALSEM
jgi:hypothetical protein